MRLDFKCLTVLALAAATLVACGGTGPSQTPSAYPGPGAYPGPIQTLDGRISLPGTPTTTADTGALRAVVSYSEGGRPIRHQLFYASKLLPVTGQGEGNYVAATDTEHDPVGETDDKGNLVISLIPAGKYALTVLTPHGATMALEGENKEITFDVTAGQVVDLGNRTILLDPSVMEPQGTP